MPSVCFRAGRERKVRLLFPIFSRGGQRDFARDRKKGVDILSGCGLSSSYRKETPTLRAWTPAARQGRKEEKTRPLRIPGNIAYLLQSRDSSKNLKSFRKGGKMLTSPNYRLSSRKERVKRLRSTALQEKKGGRGNVLFPREKRSCPSRPTVGSAIKLRGGRN